MDRIDKKILNNIQQNFPLSPLPYEELEKEIRIPKEEIFKRVKSLIEKGIIRGIRAVLNPKKLDFYSTLCAAKVPTEKMEKFISVVNSYDEVTHNYERDAELNIWFTLVAENKKRVHDIIHDISNLTGINPIYNFPAKKVFKINVKFDL